MYPHYDVACLEADGLVCLKGDRLLFKELSLSVKEGETLRVSGGNGVGKTSLLRMLCGLVRPEAGEVRWGGQSIWQERESFLSNMLYLGHELALNERLTPLENLRFSSLSAGHKTSSAQCVQALQHLGLDEEQDLPVRVLSQGQRRRAALARLVLASHRKVWILDEPFTALDALAVSQLAGVLHQHTQAGGMVVVITHHEAPFVTAPRLLDMQAWAC